MKVKDGIIGLVVGDALGVPVEFVSRHMLEKNPVFTMIGGGIHNQPPGTWSDDTSMTIATMTSIINKKSIDYTDIMDEFIEWFRNDKYTQDELFDIGNGTLEALERYESGIPAVRCGPAGERKNGNGSLMRILPLAYIDGIDYETVENLSCLTHAHKRSRIACALYVEIAKSIINKDDLTIREHVKNACAEITDHYKDNEELAHFKRIFDDDFSSGVSSKGYVVSTLEAAIYCFESTSNYRDAVLKAVNLGEDSDTVGAVCGGLAGIYYGFDDIPIDWIGKIRKVEEIVELCEKYEVVCDEYL